MLEVYGLIVFKVIMATNRADTLDPALLRPGRLDRKIEFPLPSRREKRLIFQTVTGKMNLGPDVDLEDCRLLSPPSCLVLNVEFLPDVSRPDRLSSAEIASIVQAAGLQGIYYALISVFETDMFEAVRKNRYVILPVDFEEAWKVGCLVLLAIWLPENRNLKISFLFPTTANSQAVRRHTRVL